MIIIVKTVYENIQEPELYDWADRVFKKSWVSQLQTKTFVDGLKAEFLNGEKVMCQTLDPKSAAKATTTWELLK